MLASPLQNASIFMEVEIATWRALLDANGEASRFADKDFTHQELIGSLVNGEIQPEFFSALEVIEELGTDDGRAHIQQVASDQNVSLTISASDCPSREFVAQLLLQGVGEQKIRDLIQVAQFSLRTAASVWVPFALNRCQRFAKRQLNIELTDAAMHDARIYVAVEPYEPLTETMRCIGNDRLLLGTDYGHNTDTSAEMAGHTLIQKHRDLDATSARRIISDNALQFYGLS